jgi:hypothetical protein
MKSRARTPLLSSPFVRLELGPGRDPWTLTVSRHARFRSERRLDVDDLHLVRRMVERSLANGTWIAAPKGGGQFFVPVHDTDLEGWLCAVREPPIARNSRWHTTVLTTFGRNYAPVREALGPVASHPCPERVLVEEAEAVGYMGGPIRYLQRDLLRRYTNP